RDTLAPRAVHAGARQKSTGVTCKRPAHCRTRGKRASSRLGRSAVSLSRRKQGFESPRECVPLQGLSRATRASRPRLPIFVVLFSHQSNLEGESNEELSSSCS